MKKLLALVLAVCMMFAALPAMAYGEFTGYSIASTTLYGSSSKKIQNIELAARALDGTAVYSGETFSFNEVVGPRTRERGYVSAMNGRGAVVLGGGVSQLATTLLMAIIDSNANGFEIKPFMDYGEDFVDWYADEDDWTVVTDYAAGHDFEFTNWHEEVVYINAWVDEEDVYCELVFGEPGDSIARSSTPIFGSDNKRSNILNAAFAIDGISLDYGEKFSL